MEQRDSFIFYRSFYEAVSQLKPKDQVEVILAICEYALNGTERKLTGVPSAIFLLAKPNLDASQRRFENGKKGGRPKTKGKPSQNLTETKTEPNVDKDVNGDKDVDRECKWVIGDEDGRKAAVAAVMNAYLDKVNPQISEQSRDELVGFIDVMGAECCLRAIDIAVDARKATWPYIRAILSAKQAQGVRCLADWDALETTRKQQKAGDPAAKSWAELAREMEAKAYDV